MDGAGRCLETLVRLWYLRHGFTATTSFLCQPLALIGFRCLEAIKRQDRADELEAIRSTLFLVAKGLREQSQSHYLAETLFRVIKGQMRPEEASLLGTIADIIDVADEGRNVQMRKVRSQWPVSIVVMPENLESSMLTRLVENLPSS